MARVARSEEEFEQQCKNSGGNIIREFFDRYKMPISDPTKNHNITMWMTKQKKVTVHEISLWVDKEIYSTTYKLNDSDYIYEHLITCKRK